MPVLLNFIFADWNKKNVIKAYNSAFAQEKCKHIALRGSLTGMKVHGMNHPLEFTFDRSVRTAIFAHLSSSKVDDWEIAEGGEPDVP